MSSFGSFRVFGHAVLPMCYAEDSDTEMRCGKRFPLFEVTTRDRRKTYLCENHKHLAAGRTFYEIVEEMRWPPEQRKRLKAHNN